MTPDTRYLKAGLFAVALSIAWVTATATAHGATPPDDSCPANPILSRSFAINGQPAPLGSTKPGDVVRVDFTIATGCHERFSLVSYKAPSAQFDPTTASQQVAFGVATGVFSPGAHALSVIVPRCYFQLDFVSGKAITEFGALYGPRLIDTTSGGASACDTTTTTIAPTTTTTEPKKITIVPAAVVVPTTVPKPQLAHTGSRTEPEMLVGLSLLLIGASLLGARRVKNERI